MADHGASNTMALDNPTPTPFELSEQAVQDALADGRHLLERVIEATRLSLQARENQARTPGEHHAMLDARQLLSRLGFVMCDRYPDALRQAVAAEAVQRDNAARSLFTIHFDELELMDEAQISESVERARARQILIAAVEGPLADLDALVSAALGLPTVQPERNPLRPDVFLQALQTVVSQMQVTPQVRHDWMGQLAQALGAELRTLYPAITQRLRQGGAQAVGYAMRQADGRYVYLAAAPGGASPGFAAEPDAPAPASSSAADPLLTLDRLRRLLIGEISDAAPQTPGMAPAFGRPHAAGAQQPGPAAAADGELLAIEWDAIALPSIAEAPGALSAAAPEFAMTVPAAFEALQEMNQVGQMMERLGSARRATPHAPAGGLAQALSMEVVSLMIDNIARDERLVWPVQQFVRALEPALLQLAPADPRFFSDRSHPARRLLQEITDRSLAFDSVEAPGFQDFMRELMETAGPLSTATIEGPDDFEYVLQHLQTAWAHGEQARKRERLRAIEALQHAEQRHLLAAKISREVWLLPQIGHVPAEISRFLMGPWAQVLAEAQLTDGAGSPDPGRYRELVDALIWSAQPRLTRLNTARLARLLPKLLPKLREGLATIGYPEGKTEAFFRLLMQLHQQAFKPGAEPGNAPVAAMSGAATSAAGALPPHHPAQPRPMAADVPRVEAAEPAPVEPWLAPSEAQESGYMAASLAEPAAPASTNAAAEPAPVGLLAAEAGPPAERSSHVRPPLTVGTWVNLLVGGDRWERTQLSWIGPLGTMFLFTSASGRAQSMTLRLVERLIQKGAMQVLTPQTVVDGALDAVARAAMRNSVDSRMGDCD